MFTGVTRVVGERLRKPGVNHEPPHHWSHSELLVGPPRVGTGDMPNIETATDGCTVLLSSSAAAARDQ
jgi:hypothetical protein